MILRFFTALMLLVVLFPGVGRAQFVTTPEPLTVAQTDELLRERVPLLVRLPSASKKLDFYRKKRTEDPANASSYQRRIDQIIAERDAANRLLITYLDSLYTVQPLHYFYDRDSRTLREGTARPLLNAALEPQPNLVPPERYLVLHVGNRIGGSGQGLNGLQLLDANYQPLPYGVPSFSRRGGFGALWRALGNRARAEERDVERMVTRLHRRVNNYLEN